jgi:hypothetical protein
MGLYWLGTQQRILYHRVDASSTPRKPLTKRKRTRSACSEPARHLPRCHTKCQMWDIYGTLLAWDPTENTLSQSGRILSRNRHFIRKCSISGSYPGPAAPPSPCRSSSPTTCPPSQPTTRRSSRMHHKPFHLYEDPTWLFSSSVPMTSELGGEV